MSGSRSTTEAIYLLRNLMEKYQSKRKDLHIIFINLKKAYCVPRNNLESFGKKMVRVEYIKVIKDMYEEVMTSVRTPRGETNDFPIRIGLHQGLTLSPYLFNLVLDSLNASIQDQIPKCMFLRKI